MGALDRVAVVSDVHGNLTAYESVLADIDTRGITRVVNLGDLVGKGPQGAACVRLTRDRGIPTVQGNWEAFLTGDFDRGTAMWWSDELEPGQADWLADLPFCHDLVLSGRRVRMLHASPQGVFSRVSYVHSQVDYERMFLNTDFTGDGPAPSCVLYGDIHGTYLQGDDNQTLVNVGSVGNPLDATTSSYVILEGVAGSPDPAPFGIQFVRVPFDTEREIAVAEASGMPEAEEYAIELRTGLYRGYQR